MCDQVEQRRIRSLNRQRANVRPINSSPLPLEQRNPFGTGAAGGDGVGTSHGKKLGQVEVEPIEVRSPSKTALPCLSLVCCAVCPSWPCSSLWTFLVNQSHETESAASA